MSIKEYLYFRFKCVLNTAGNPYKILVRRPEGKRPFTRNKRRWEDYIKMVLKEFGRDVVSWGVQFL